MSYVLMTDSSADLPWSYLREHNIPCVPMTVAMGGESFEDNEDYDMSGFFQRLRNGEVATTSQISRTTFHRWFAPHLEQGRDILYVGLTDGLSGNYHEALAEAEVLSEQFPDNQVYVCQTSCVSMGLGLLVHNLRRLRDDGLDFEGLCQWAEENKLRHHHLFTVEDLMFLHRGGRVSRTSAIVGSILGIKPTMHVSPEGKLINHGKVRGRRQSLLAMVEDMKTKTDLAELEAVGLVHGDCEEDARFVLDEVQKHFTVHNEIVRLLGPTIGAHSGPGTVALFFIGHPRTE